MLDIIVKKVSIDDLTELQNIGRRTFEETFSEFNSAENMQRYLSEEFSLEKLSRELNNTDSHFYFALVNGAIVGYLKVNDGEAQTELKDRKALEIERIYVSKAFHGKNVGQTLYLKVIEIAKQNAAEYVWLGVWEENPKAIRFYQKNGFVTFDKHLFKLGEDEQTDLMMRLDLR